jgi:hypothetical protein
MKILTCCLLLFSATFALAQPWEDLQSQYFSKLNLRVPNTALKEIPEYAFKLSSFVDSLNGADKETDGLVLIYDALLIMNNNKGIKEGVLQLEDFKRLRAYAPAGSTDLTEMKARAEFALKELITAAKLRPNDQRISSWIAGARHGILLLENGDRVPEESLRAAIDAIPLRPTFNLWSAILIFRTQNAGIEMFGELATAGKNFVNHLGDPTNPCLARPEDCQNGIKARYNLQSSLVTLGDTFLRRAEYLLETGDIGQAMELLSYAKGTYDQLFTAKNIKHTQSWYDQDVIAERREYIVEMLRTRKPRKILLHQTANYARPYECASCHGR